MFAFEKKTWILDEWLPEHNMSVHGVSSYVIPFSSLLSHQYDNILCLYSQKSLIKIIEPDKSDFQYLKIIFYKSYLSYQRVISR